MRVYNRLGGMIGLAAKAGKVVSGEMAVVAAAQKKKAAMLLADASASANTKDKIGKLASAYELPLLYVEDLGAAVGKPGRTMVALCDTAFANAIGKLANERNTGV